MRVVLPFVLLLLAPACGDDDLMAIGPGGTPFPGTGSGSDGGMDAGADAALDGALPFGCVALTTGPAVNSVPPFTSRSAEAFFQPASSCDAEANLIVRVYDDDSCAGASASLEITVPVEDPTVAPGEVPIGFGAPASS